MPDELKPVKVSEIVKDITKSFDSSITTAWYSNLLGFLSGSKSFYVLLIISGIVVFVSAMAGANAVNIGYRHAYGLSREVVFGILISTYIFFAVTSTGISIVSSIGHVFGVKDFMPIAMRSVFLAVATLFAGFTVIFLDIENPFRMAIYNAISPNLTSNIWWMGTLYGAKLVFLAIEFILLLIACHKLAMYAGLLGLLSGVAAISNLGAVFGMLHGREFWYGPYIPIYLITSAIASGCAAIIFFTYLGYKVNNEMMDKPMQRAMEVVGKLCTLMVAIIMFFTAWKIITGFVAAPGKVEAIKAMLSGPYSFNFWVFEVSLGMVIPFILLIWSKGKNINMMFTASSLMIIGIFIMRYDLVVVGQIVPSYHELGVNEYPSILTYRPSFYEIMVVLGGMGIVAVSFLIGERVFKGHKGEIH